MTDLQDLEIHADALRAARAKYKPHLSFRAKAAIYALYHLRGVSVSALGQAFEVHKLTALHIVDANPKHYPDVKAKASEMGLEGLYNAYVQAEDIERLNATAPVQRAPRLKPRAKPNPIAAAYQGKQTVDGIEVIIDWLGVDNGRRSPDRAPGWYWRLLEESDYHGIETDGRAGASSNDVRAWLQQNSEWLVSYYRRLKDSAA